MSHVPSERKAMHEGQFMAASREWSGLLASEAQTWESELAAFHGVVSEATSGEMQR